MSLYIDAHEKLAASELEDFCEYAELVDRLMHEHAGQHRSHVFATLESLTKAERVSYALDNFDQYEKLTDRFPNLQHASLLVLGYSLAESQLVSISRRVLSASGLGLTLKDLAGDSPLQKARKCLTKIGRFDLAEETWLDLDAYRQLRNAVAHSGGHFPDDQVPPVVAKLMARNSAITYTNHEGIALEIGYLSHLVGTLKDLQKSVFQEWRRRLTGAA